PPISSRVGTSMPVSSARLLLTGLLEGFRYRLDDPIHRGQDVIFEPVRGRQRDVRRGDADGRPGERAERLLGHDRDDLRAPPHSRGFSSTVNSRPVLATSARIVRVSSGTSDLTSTTVASMPSSADSFSAAASARGTIAASARIVASPPWRSTLAR